MEVSSMRKLINRFKLFMYDNFGLFHTDAYVNHVINDRIYRNR